MCTSEYDTTDNIEREYIRMVLLNDEIDIEHSQENLMYFFLSKRKEKEIVLYECFVKNYEMIREERKKLD